MARIHGIIATTLSLIAMVFYIIGMATPGTYEFDFPTVTVSQSSSGTGIIVTAAPSTLGPWSFCYDGAYDDDCKLPTTKCQVEYAIAGTSRPGPFGTDGTFTLPKCDNYNAYRAFIVIAFAFSVIGFLVMIYTTFRTGAWTAYYIGSAFVGISAVMGLIAMAIAADYKRVLEDEIVNENRVATSTVPIPVEVNLRYGFALPLIAWIIQIPACIIFAWTAK